MEVQIALASFALLFHAFSAFHQRRHTTEQVS